MLLTSFDSLTDPYCHGCGARVPWNVVPGSDGHCGKCLEWEWYVVSKPVVQGGVVVGIDDDGEPVKDGGVILRGLFKTKVKWSRSSKADIDDRKRSAEQLPAPAATTTPQPAPTAPSSQLASAPQPAPTVTTPTDSTAVLTPQEFAILTALAAQPKVAMIQADIGDNTEPRLSLPTIGRWLKKLRQRGLTASVNSGGEYITEKGLSLVQDYNDRVIGK